MSNRITSYENSFKNIYGTDRNILRYQNERYSNLIDRYVKYFGKNRVHLFSTPGRTELGGNHTDHNQGQVLAGSVNLDSIAVVSKNNESLVTLYSNGFVKPFIVDLNSLMPLKEEVGKTNSLIRGIAARFVELGYKIGGFCGVLTSNVLQGSGLSSSASIEVLISTIFNELYNSNSIQIEEIAKISQYAENEYFGKPCGLMDQMACAVGGIITIDFANISNPIVEKVNFDFEMTGYSLIVIDTGGNHVDLTDDYESIPKEMKSVANYFEKFTCREIDYTSVLENISELRSKLGDRAILRAIHFLLENERVVKQVEALKSNRFNVFLDLIIESGNSSFKWLQNIYSSRNAKEQGLTLALAITENYINEIGEGACRVHGGGFAGTIQVFLPSNRTYEYQKQMQNIFGEECVNKLYIRNVGAICLAEVDV